MSAASQAQPPKPRAWLHTLHMELGQTQELLLSWGPGDLPSNPDLNGFGIPGVSYDPSYTVTMTPLYAAAPPTLSPDAALSLAHELWVMAQLKDGEDRLTAVSRMARRLLRTD